MHTALAAVAMAGLQAGIDVFDDMISTNLRSVYLLTSLATPHLIKTKGNIVNVSSVVSIKPKEQFMPYCVSKARLDMFTKCAAKELAPNQVRVNSVNPGPGRISTSEDVAKLVALMASDDACSMTGSIYFIDNGFLLPSTMPWK